MMLHIPSSQLLGYREIDLTATNKALKMLRAGVPASQVARDLNISRQTIWRWRFRDQKKLRIQMDPGRPSYAEKRIGRRYFRDQVLNEIYLNADRTSYLFDEMKDRINSGSANMLGRYSHIWTPKRLAEEIRRRTGTQVSLSLVRDLFRKLFSPTLHDRISWDRRKEIWTWFGDKCVPKVRQVMKTKGDVLWCQMISDMPTDLDFLSAANMYRRRYFRAVSSPLSQNDMANFLVAIIYFERYKTFVKRKKPLLVVVEKTAGINLRSVVAMIRNIKSIPEFDYLETPPITKNFSLGVPNS